MRELILSGLFIYPVKSLSGISLKQSELDRFGLQYDRRWMLVDKEGGFLSQRRLPRMALIRQQILGNELVLSAQGVSELHLPLKPLNEQPIQVKVWEDLVEAQLCAEVAHAWFTDFLDYPCRLVAMPDDGRRGVDLEYAETSDQTAFSDGFPLLLISEASLAELNERLDEPLPMSRFRPNLVVSGCRPYTEDGWSKIRIGELGFRVVKPCSRCIITTIDPVTAKTGKEPLKTLHSYRKQGNKVYFGQNLLHDGTGRLSTGMTLKVLEIADE